MQQARQVSSSEYPFVCRDDFKPLRNKHDPCSGCRRPPPQGEKFLRCSGCRSVLYCSKQCQNAHWGDHRSECKRIRQLLNATQGTPRHVPAGDRSWSTSLSQVQRDVVLKDFTEYHRQNVMNAITSLRRSLHPGDLDTATQAIFITFEFSDDKEGGPATRLFLKKIAIASRGVRELCDIPRCKNCLSQLVVTYQLDDLEKCETMGLERLTPEELNDAQTEGMDWVEYLRFAIALGMVLKDDENDPSGARMGYMRKEGNKWKWEEISAQFFMPFWEQRATFLNREPVPEVDMGNVNTRPHSTQY